jgi:hypothetical protein
MDEADVLCSRIAILAAGRLRCIGPQQVCICSRFSRISGNHVGVQMLKTRYGDGYVIRVNFVPERQAEVERFVRCAQSSKARWVADADRSTLVPTAEMNSESASSASFSVPRAGVSMAQRTHSGLILGHE